MKRNIIYLTLSFIILSMIFQLNLKSNADFIMEPASNDYNTYSTNSSYNNNVQNDISIDVQPPMSFSYKTKQEIYNLRKNAVAKSIFKNPNYEPSGEVFGQIEDNKPWVSMNACFFGNKACITGDSEESRFVLNPTILVAIEYVYGAYCTTGQYIPNLQAKSIKYSKSKNEIVVTYDKLKHQTLDRNTEYSFKGLNARDLGYKYAYIDKEKSTYNLIFTDKNNNISTNIAEFQDFLHTGGSCGHEGGCNNGSPHQPMLDFENSHRDGTSYQNNKEIYIKLWKVKPNSPQDKPDIVERIIIENA